MGDPKAEIRALIEERVSAMRARDAHRAISTLSEDVVAFELAPPLAVRAITARNEEGLTTWLEGFDEIDIQSRDLAIEADEHIGFAHALHHLTGTRVGGVKVSLWMRSTLCFRREIQGWRIAHAHTSVPSHMDGSLRAAVDLRP